MSVPVLRTTDFSSPPVAVDKKSVLCDEVLSRRVRAIGTPLNSGATTEKVALDSQVLATQDNAFPGVLAAGSGRTVVADALQVKGNTAVNGGDTDAQMALTNDSGASYSLYCGGSAALAPFVPSGLTLFNHTNGAVLAQTSGATDAAGGGVLSIGTFEDYGATTKTGPIAAQSGRGVSGDGSPGTSPGLFEVFHPAMTISAVVLATALGVDTTGFTEPYACIVNLDVGGAPATRKANIWVYNTQTGNPVNLAAMQYHIVKL